jgi:hypothetical protein
VRWLHQQLSGLEENWAPLLVLCCGFVRWLHQQLSGLEENSGAVVGVVLWLCTLASPTTFGTWKEFT